MDTITIALKRVLALDFQNRRHSSESQISTHALLMKEYLRRMLLWKKALKVDQWPFNSFSEHFAKLTQLEGDKILHQLMTVSFPNARVAGACAAFVFWSHVENRQEVKAFELPNPYEPLIRMFELGCWFSVESNMIDLWNLYGERATLTLASDLYDRTTSFINLDEIIKPGDESSLDE